MFGENNKATLHGTVPNAYDTIQNHTIRPAESTEALSFGGLSSAGCDLPPLYRPMGRAALRLPIIAQAKLIIGVSEAVLAAVPSRHG